MNGTRLQHPVEPRARILVATGVAAAGALLALVLFVLPAEHGIDPLGTGAALGLLALAEGEADAGALVSAAVSHSGETTAFELQPFESVEYKYRLEQDDVMVFSWRASGEVVAELHAEPDGAPEGYAQSFEKVRGAAGQGSYRAPFAGWHGWFWENRGMEAVTVTLDAAGFFSAARTYRGGHVWEEDKGPVRPWATPSTARD